MAQAQQPSPRVTTAINTIMAHVHFLDDADLEGDAAESPSQLAKNTRTL